MSVSEVVGRMRIGIDSWRDLIRLRPRGDEQSSGTFKGI
jgi:hypothetical protein